MFRRVECSDGGNNDNGREAGISLPADLCLTRYIAILNWSRFIKS